MRHRSRQSDACQKKSEGLVIKELSVHPLNVPQAQTAEQFIESLEKSCRADHRASAGKKDPGRKGDFPPHVGCDSEKSSHEKDDRQQVEKDHGYTELFHS
jgi:hypothetical protein